MELSQGKQKVWKLAEEDIIGSMPDNVVTHILDRLPLQDAVRTSILSRNWRFRWTMLSQLVFDENFVEYLIVNKCQKSYERIISRLILHLRGAITKFVLFVNNECCPIHVEDISHWILFLSKKGIKDLSLVFWNSDGLPLKLPTHLFSCLELKHLKLEYCCFDPPTAFSGFPNLLSLELHMVQFQSKKFGEFFTRCPVLEILSIDDLYYAAKVKLATIAKLTNLKILSLYLCYVDNNGFRSIFELVGSLPKLQELHLDFDRCKFTQDGSNNRLPTTFSFLKTLKLSKIELNNGIMLSCAFEVIRSFSNLQTLEIKGINWDTSSTPTVCSSEVDYNTMGLLQLRRVVMDCKGSENEVCLIKYLLACSFYLKKIVIRPASSLKPEDKYMFAQKLLKLYRASPVVDIDLY